MTPTELVLYSKPGCHLCEDTRVLLDELLASRARRGQSVPTVVERDITTDDEWHRAFWDSIPVLEIGSRRLLLAIRPSQIQAFLDAALEAAAVGT